MTAPPDPMTLAMRVTSWLPVKVFGVKWARKPLWRFRAQSSSKKLRARTRCDYVTRLRDLLAPSTRARHDYALWGYFGFIDAAALRWVDNGCPEEDRWALMDAALGALEGALGDWAA